MRTSIFRLVIFISPTINSVRAGWFDNTPTPDSVDELGDDPSYSSNDIANNAINNWGSTDEAFNFGDVLKPALTADASIACAPGNNRPSGKLRARGESCKLDEAPTEEETTGSDQSPGNAPVVPVIKPPSPPNGRPTILTGAGKSVDFQNLPFQPPRPNSQCGSYPDTHLVRYLICDSGVPAEIVQNGAVLYHAIECKSLV